MRRVLYLTNKEVPYRVRFFNELAKCCDLTVLYETKNPGSRNHQWAKSEERQHRAKFIQRDNIKTDDPDTVSLWEELSAGYDVIIVGCYNTRIQMAAILYMRMKGIPYIINLDGEAFLEGNGMKALGKRFFLRGAQKYLVAGEKSAESLRKIIKKKEIIPYYFSSLSQQEIEDHRKQSCNSCRYDTILVVGQYYDYKGMDIALKTAQMDKSLQYKLVGMGSRTDLFLKDYADKIPENVEIIPFLQKEELEKEYRNCAMLVLPSRQECWGLVINEAASFGMPIVSTWGSGAAVEFLADEYPQYLAKPGDAESLYRGITELRETAEKEAYCRFLLEKSKDYSIDKSVRRHVNAF